MPLLPQAGLTPLTHAIHRLTCVESENEKAAALECSLMLLRSEKVDKRNSVVRNAFRNAPFRPCGVTRTRNATGEASDASPPLERRTDTTSSTPSPAATSTLKRYRLP